MCSHTTTKISKSRRLTSVIVLSLYYIRNEAPNLWWVTLEAQPQVTAEAIKQ